MIQYIHDLSRRADIFNTANKATPGRLRWSTEDDRILLSRMLAMCSKAEDETDIIWDHLSTSNWHPWPGSMLRHRWSRMRSRVPGHESMSLPGKDTPLCLSRRAKLIPQSPFVDTLQYCFQYLHTISSSKAKKRDMVISQEVDEEEDSEMTAHASASWTTDDSQELISRILTLCEDAEDEEDVDWENIVWAPWDAGALRKQFAELAARVPDAHNMAFMEVVKYAGNHLKDLAAIASPELVSRMTPPHVSDAVDDADGVFVSLDPLSGDTTVQEHQDRTEEEDEEEAAKEVQPEPKRKSSREKRKASDEAPAPSKKEKKKAKKAKKRKDH
jgi:hypothetical protein